MASLGRWMIGRSPILSARVFPCDPSWRPCCLVHCRLLLNPRSLSPTSNQNGSRETSERKKSYQAIETAGRWSLYYMLTTKRLDDALIRKMISMNLWRGFQTSSNVWNRLFALFSSLLLVLIDWILQDTASVWHASFFTNTHTLFLFFLFSLLLTVVLCVFSGFPFSFFFFFFFF